MGQGAAVDAEKIRHFFPGHGNGQGAAAPLVGLHGQIGHNPVPQTPLGQNRQPVFLFHVLLRDQGQQLVQDLLAAVLRERTGLQQQIGLQKENPGRRLCHGVVRGQPGPGADQIGAHQLRRLQHIRQGDAAVVKQMQQLHASLQYHAQFVHLVLRLNQEFAPGKFPRPAPGQQLPGDRCFRQGPEQQACLQSLNRFHMSASFSIL